MSLPGMDFVSPGKEPQVTLPKDWTGLKICLKITGGVGDALISIASCAAYLAHKPCEVTAVVRQHQVELFNHVAGVSKVMPVVALNRNEVRNSFDVVLDFEGTFNTSRQLKSERYYQLVSARLGAKVEPGILMFDRTVEPGAKPVVCLHPGASIGNRRWDDVKWFDLAYTAAEANCHVRFLGTKDEFGFSDTNANILKLSDRSDNLLWQCRQLANADYFVGNDSGFCHVAGLLNVTGLVLFFATDSNHVISEYSSLTGLDRYDEIGVVPSRSLRSDDPVADRAREAMTVADVVRHMEVISATDCTISRKPSQANQYRLALVSNSDAGGTIAQLLGSHFDVVMLSSPPSKDNTFDAVILVREDRVTVQVREGSPVRIASDSADTVRRAIRELLCMEHDP